MTSPAPIGPGAPTLAIDVGGTGINAGFFDADGVLVHKHTEPTGPPATAPPPG